MGKVRTVVYFEDYGAADETAVPLQPRLSMQSAQPQQAPAPAPVPEPAALDVTRIEHELERKIRAELEQQADDALRTRLSEVRYGVRRAWSTCRRVGNCCALHLQLETQWAAKESVRQKEFEQVRKGCPTLPSACWLD